MTTVAPSRASTGPITDPGTGRGTLSGLRRPGRALLPVAGVALLGVAWWVATDVLGTSSSALPAFSTVIDTARSPAGFELAWTNFLVTARSTLVGLALALLVGIPGGALLAFAHKLGRLAQPGLSFYMAFPNVAFIPIMILVFGFGSSAVIALGFVTGLPYIVANAQAAFARVDQNLLQVAAVYCGSPVRRFGKIIVPGSLPALASGTRIGAGRVLMGVVVGEMFGSNDGLGARLVYTANFFDMASFYVTFLALLLLGAAVTFGFQLLESRAALVFRMK